MKAYLVQSEGREKYISIVRDMSSLSLVLFASVVSFYCSFYISGLDLKFKVLSFSIGLILGLMFLYCNISWYSIVDEISKYHRRQGTDSSFIYYFEIICMFFSLIAFYIVVFFLSMQLSVEFVMLIKN